MCAKEMRMAHGRGNVCVRERGGVLNRIIDSVKFVAYGKDHTKMSLSHNLLFSSALKTVIFDNKARLKTSQQQLGVHPFSQ